MSNIIVVNPEAFLRTQTTCSFNWITGGQAAKLHGHTLGPNFIDGQRDWHMT